jgi:hypothetical protein
VLALAIVVGSYFTAEYLRVWRPRRRGEKAATFGSDQSAVMAEVCYTAETLAESAAAADAEMNARLAAAAEQPSGNVAAPQAPRPAAAPQRES